MASKALGEQVFRNGRVTPGWKAVLAATLAIVFGPSALLGTTFGVLAAGLERETGWSHADVAKGAMLVSLTLMISAPLQGYLVDRIGARRVVLIFVPIFGAGLICLRLGTASPQAFYFACALATLSGLGLWPTSFIRIMASWFERRLGLVIGIVTSGLSLSTILLPILLPIGFRRFDWGTTYTILGVFVLFVVWPVLYRWLHLSADAITMPDSRNPALNEDKSRFVDAFRTRTLWIALATFIMFGFANASLLVHGIAIMKSNGVDAQTALQLYSITGMGLLFGRVGTGWLLDRMNARTVLFLAFVLLFLAYAVWLSPFAVALAGPALALGGIVIGAEFDVLGVMVRRSFDAALFGRIYGLVLCAFSLGNALGAVGITYFASQAGSFREVIAWLSTASLVCAAIALLLKRDTKFSSSLGRAAR